MPSFSLVIEYLTGYAVATDSSSRDLPEWPPHPARVYMALAAAHFENEGPADAKRAERDALDWLSELDPPDLTAPECTTREVQTVYVPVNDQSAGDALLHRSRQPRMFPRVYVGSEPLRQTWHVPDDAPLGDHLAALEGLCPKVTRIGHSSSLVWVRLERDGGIAPTYVPDTNAIEKRLRITLPGSLRRLEEAFNKNAIDEFGALEEQIATSKGKAKRLLQDKLDEAFPLGRPTSQRPSFSIRHGYRQATPKRVGPITSTWDPSFIVLREAEEATQSIGLESTAQVMSALRNLLMSQSPEQPAPSWVCGHEPNGERLQSGSHMALIPLPFVGSKYADGHLLGVGILLPRELSYRERSRILSPILFDAGNNACLLKLTMGRSGVWHLVRENDVSPKQSLRTNTYCGPSRCWASVTPVVLDRMPKSDRSKDPVDWRMEVAAIITKSCSNVGLPEPISVRVEKTPFFTGSLRAMPGQGGFPQLRPGRFQVHVALEFAQEVEGPILLGAGRFRGYGLLRPWVRWEGQ
jgi:CRISPR-associated protein Csb2